MNYYFNIHDIFSILICDAPPNTGEYILRELKYFRATTLEKVNLVIRFVEKIISPDSHVCLLKDLHYKEGLLYFNFTEGKLYLPIKDLPNEQMTIIAEKTVLPYTIFLTIEKIMYLKLLEKDFCFLHAASYNDSKQTILYSSLPGTGKTNWILGKCSNGVLFLSDDLTIIDRKGFIFAYPRAFTLGKYHKKFFNIYLKSMNKYTRFRYNFLKYCLSLFVIFAIPFPRLKRKIKKYLISIDYFRIRIEDVIPNLKILRKARLDKIILAFKTDSALDEKTQWNNKRVVNFLIHNTNRELFKFVYLHFLAFFSYGDDYSNKIKHYLSSLFFKQQRIIYSIVNNCQTEICYNNKCSVISNYP